MLLATYGTLMRVYGAARRLGVSEQLVFEAPCRIPGVLYDFGRFPGAVPPDHAPASDGASEDALGDAPGEAAGDASPVVHGELFRVTDPRALTTVDQYEGYDPDREAASLFVRRRVALLAPPETTAWVYWYNGDVTAGTLVPSGDWRDTRA